MTIHELVNMQRRAFFASQPSPVENRLDQLELLKKAIESREDQICSALQKDLGKCREEAGRRSGGCRKTCRQDGTERGPECGPYSGG